MLGVKGRYEYEPSDVTFVRTLRKNSDDKAVKKLLEWIVWRYLNVIEKDTDRKIGSCSCRCPGKEVPGQAPAFIPFP